MSVRIQSDGYTWWQYGKEEHAAAEADRATLRRLYERIATLCADADDGADSRIDIELVRGLLREE